MVESISQLQWVPPYEEKCLLSRLDKDYYIKIKGNSAGTKRCVHLRQISTLDRVHLWKTKSTVAFIQTSLFVSISRESNHYMYITLRLQEIHKRFKLERFSQRWYRNGDTLKVYYMYL